MAIESERRFLVPEDYKFQKKYPQSIRQGYLSVDPDRTVRVRIKDTLGGSCYKATMTIKGRKSSSGAGIEHEFPLEVDVAVDLLNMCTGSIVDKTRYVDTIDGQSVEIDVFHGDNDGLIIAEIEDCPEGFVPPKGWEEITDRADLYSNASLSKSPYIYRENYK